MCGFAGIFSFSQPQPDITESLLKGMGDTIAHRGPDDEGFYVSPHGRLGFAFRRLSIIDLSPAGHQPMSTPDGGVTIVFNGEIYNHLAIRAELERDGYRYRSRSDTETLLYAYERWGERFVDRLEGMFAIALWDQRRERLLLYRDRIGVKPLYYTVARNQLLFGSEIKAILHHPATRAEISEEAFYHYLTFIHTPAPLTMFRGVYKLRAGHFLCIERDGTITDTEYWDAIADPDPAVDYRDEQAVATRIRTLFDEAVAKRMMSDVPFGVFLSGGIDSSANVAFMAKLMDRPVDTFTVAIEGQEDTNELRWARRISTLFGTNHHEVVISDSGFLEFLPTVVHHQDEPLADPVCFPLYHVSKLARDNGTIVVQVGEGSDEQFAGYRNYLLAARLLRWSNTIRAIPRPLRTLGYSAVLSPLLRARRIDYRQNMIRHLMTDVPVFWGNAIAFYDDEKHRLLDGGTPPWRSSHDLVEERLARLRARRPTEPLDEIIYWEIKNRLAELLLMRVDKVTMATSLEARVPFLDHKLVEFTSTIPPAMKTRGGTPKSILKAALRGIIPDDIIDRRKIGFAGSGRNMLTPEIFRHARALLEHNRHGRFSQPYLRGLFDEYERRRINYTPQIWALYNFELWHRWWIEGDRSF